MGDIMKSIRKQSEVLYEIKHSKFYALLYRVDTKEEIQLKMKQVKEKYKDATHYCYAYILDAEQKCSDDGEPSGTAGIPILNILKQNECDHILCIVVRYFGGIKLGAGGLLRAYSKSASLLFEKNDLIEIETGYLIQIKFPYEKKKQIDFLLKEEVISYQEYEEEIQYEVKISLDHYKKLKDALEKECSSIIIKEELWI